jgi:hypothetical protein
MLFVLLGFAVEASFRLDTRLPGMHDGAERGTHPGRMR